MSPMMSLLSRFVLANKMTWLIGLTLVAVLEDLYCVFLLSCICMLVCVTVCVRLYDQLLVGPCSALCPIPGSHCLVAPLSLAAKL